MARPLHTLQDVGAPVSLRVDTPSFEHVVCYSRKSNRLGVLSSGHPAGCVTGSAHTEMPE